jgi:Asp-tRNA(Asn)/Glu-tRNA(Gln) amidotransferase A subunit family amidase
LDFVICPGFATEACNHGSSKDGSLLASYNFVFNLLGMTSCAQPITVTKENELNYESDWEDPLTELVRNNLKDAAGMPVGIQVVGLPFS